MIALLAITADRLTVRCSERFRAVTRRAAHPQTLRTARAIAPPSLSLLSLGHFRALAMKHIFALLLLGATLLFAGCSPRSFTPTNKLEVRLINQQFDGAQYHAYVVINQFFDAATEKPVEVALDRQKHHAEALLVCNHLETGSGGLSQNLKVYQIQILQPQQLRLTRDHFTWLPAGYALPELTITRTQ